MMTPVERHVAGATIQHESPFCGLSVPIVYEPPREEIRERWIRPLYFGLGEPHVAGFVRANASAATDDLIHELLSHFDWRSKVAGAYLAALRRRTGFTEQMGCLLLRSDVAFAGAAYCLALAEFNTDEGLSFLCRYLDHYLSQTHLWFDQSSAMAALAYLDEKNATETLSRYASAWEAFVANKSHWNLQASIAHFAQKMDTLHALQAASGG